MLVPHLWFAARDESDERSHPIPTFDTLMWHDLRLHATSTKVVPVHYGSNAGFTTVDAHISEEYDAGGFTMGS